MDNMKGIQCDVKFASAIIHVNLLLQPYLTLQTAQHALQVADDNTCVTGLFKFNLKKR